MAGAIKETGSNKETQNKINTILKYRWILTMIICVLLISYLVGTNSILSDHLYFVLSPVSINDLKDAYNVGENVTFRIRGVSCSDVTYLIEDYNGGLIEPPPAYCYGGALGNEYCENGEPVYPPILFIPPCANIIPCKIIDEKYVWDQKEIIYEEEKCGNVTINKAKWVQVPPDRYRIRVKGANIQKEFIIK